MTEKTEDPRTIESVSYLNAKSAANDLEERLRNASPRRRLDDDTDIKIGTSRGTLLITDVDPDHEDQVVDVETEDGWRPYYPSEINKAEIV